MPGKNLSRFLGNEKARAKVLSVAITALMVLAAFTGLFLLSDRASANPATYTYTDNFEDDTVGQYPTEDWYLPPVFGAATTGTYDYNVSDYNDASWTKTVHLYTQSNSDAVFVVYNLTADGSTSTDDTPEYFSYDVLANSTCKGGINFHNASGWGSSERSQTIFFQTDGYISANPGDTLTNLCTYTANTWYHINVTFNWTTHKTRIVITHDSTTDYDGWINFRNNVDSMRGFCLDASSTSTTADIYFDNITIGTDTQLYEGSSLPSAPTGATATAYTKFDITLSGYDGNSRFNFSTFNTNDTAGDTIWSNSTSYGILKVTNAGIQQINLSWTKGTGATKTYIRRDTTSHATWTLSTGSLLANVTDNYYNIGSLSPGTHYYFALWSWNSSGYSDTYATCDAIVGNASVTNLTIHMEDGGTGTALLPKENITLYGNASGTFAPLGAFDATTGNITLTTTYAGLPLAIGSTLYFEFKSIIGAGAKPNGTYYDNNTPDSLDCKVRAER